MYLRKVKNWRFQTKDVDITHSLVTLQFMSDMRQRVCSKVMFTYRRLNYKEKKVSDAFPSNLTGLLASAAAAAAAPAALASFCPAAEMVPVRARSHRLPPRLPTYMMNGILLLGVFSPKPTVHAIIKKRYLHTTFVFPDQNPPKKTIIIAIIHRLFSRPPWRHATRLCNV